MESGKAEHWKAEAPARGGGQTRSALLEAGFTEEQARALDGRIWEAHDVAESTSVPAAVRSALIESTSDLQERGSLSETIRSVVSEHFDRKMDRFAARLTGEDIDGGWKSHSAVTALEAWARRIAHRSHTGDGLLEILEGRAVDDFIEDGSPNNCMLLVLEAAVHRFRNETAKDRARRLTNRLMNHAESAAVSMVKLQRHLDDIRHRGKDDPDVREASLDIKKADLRFAGKVSELTRALRGTATMQSAERRRVDEAWVQMMRKYQEVPKAKWDESSRAALTDPEARLAKKAVRKAVKALARKFCELQERAPLDIPLPKW